MEIATTKSASVREKDATDQKSELTILIIAPTSNDARLTADFLYKAGFASSICENVTAISDRLGAGCGALLLAEEALASETTGALVRELNRQPSWSDLPVILITAAGETSRLRSHYLAALEPVGNIAIIERPVRPETLLSACQVALRSRRRQYQVRDLLKTLDEADRRKDEFLAMLAHELRNPVAAIVNAASLLSNAIGDDQEWAKGVITRQSGQLARLIDDLLDVSRITTGKIRLQREVIDAAIVLDRARDSVSALINSRNHALICSYTAATLWLDADPARLEQITINLLTNAAKYTPAGGRIELSARRAGGEILITVRDNGIGIVPQRLPEMFKLFAQGERSIARSEGGLGIGLTIVKRLVEMHGGRLDAHSAGVGCGSCFTVCLPAASEPRLIRREAVKARDSIRQRVLVVDDNIDAAAGLARLLTRAGHETLVAYDGVGALRQAIESHPAAVVLDIGLPGMDGYEVAKQLRAGTCRDAMIIAVTGYGQPEDRKRALTAGFDHHLVKPVDVAQINKLLQEHHTH